MYRLSYNREKDQNIGELVFEILLNSRVESITDLNFGNNTSWFMGEEKSGNIDLMTEFISRQTNLQTFYFNRNELSSNATKKILT